MSEKGERQGPPHDESIVDPDKAHYMANKEKPVHDQEIFERNTEEILKALKKRREEITQKKSIEGGYPTSSEVSDNSGLAYDLAKKYNKNELDEALAMAKNGDYSYFDIIEEAIELKKSQQEETPENAQ